MITGLDHVVVLAADIKAGAAGVSEFVLPETPSWAERGRGRPRRVLFTLDNMTLELMAPSGDGATAGPHSRCAV